MITFKSRFFKLQESKKFGYQPRYYDERKEKISQLFEEYKKENSHKDEAAVKREFNFRQKTQKWSSDRNTANELRAKNLRLVVILAGLLFAMYYLLQKIDLFVS
ncbi:MAG: hypothetical protein ACOZCO_02665 [Bacteroidota bacterium]